MSYLHGRVFDGVFRHAYGEKIRVRHSSDEKSRTKQEFRDECDVNRIMARYMSSGELPAVNQVAPQFLDATAIGDYQTAMMTVAAAQSLFNDLPSSLRKRFSDDPGQFVDFCSDEKNRSELKELGLLRPEAEIVVPVPPAPAPIVPPAETPAP